MNKIAGKSKVKRIYDNEGNLISKECTCCHEVKLVSEFHKHIRKIDGFHSECKECNKKYRQENKKSIKEYHKKYYQENKESKREYQRKYDQENKESKREYYQGNKEFKREYNKKRYQENKDKIKEKHKKYREENKDKINKRQREYGKEYNDKKVQEALQQIKTEVESNPEKYNYREGEKIYGVIYLVNNIKSNKYYVGQTTRAFNIRYKSGWLHEHGCKNSVKEDLGLYGENSFKYIKLFKVAHSQYELDKLEAYYIDYYNSYENGYNETRGNIFTDRGKEK